MNFMGVFGSMIANAVYLGRQYCLAPVRDGGRVDLAGVERVCELLQSDTRGGAGYKDKRDRCDGGQVGRKAHISIFRCCVAVAIGITCPVFL